jgi:hypothetical protein
MPTFTFPLSKKKYFRFNIQFFLVFSLCFFTKIVFPDTAEFRMHVGPANTLWASTVELYSTNSYLLYPGSSSSTSRGNFSGVVINFVADVSGGIGEPNTPSSSMPMVSPGSYLLKIGDKYCNFTIYSNFDGHNADFNLNFDGYNFTRLDDPNVGRPISLSTTYTWTDNLITIKNSFNAAGQMMLDGVNTTIPAAGSTFNFESSTFPHTFSAIDQQPTGVSYMQRFTSWTTNGLPESYDRAKTISTGSYIYTSNFQNEYNITFQNIFSGSSAGGKIIVGGIEHPAPYQTTALNNTGIYASAENNSINGIVYSFYHWSDGSTEWNNHHFSPITNETETAYYKGKPDISNRGLYFNASRANQPITVLWNENPNTNVTKYQIWRRLKYQKQPTNSPQLIATVNRGTTNYIDNDYFGTNLGFTDWILWYDVRPYFSLDSTYSDSSWVQVFSNGPIPKIGHGNSGYVTENIYQNKIDNYPNPFNPTTMISYQLINSGNVSLKVYNCLGKEIAELVNEDQYSGKYNISFKNANLASGIYFYRIVANGFVETKKMILTK